MYRLILPTGNCSPARPECKPPLPYENLVTALTPSEMACLASSPGRMRRTAVCTSRDVTVALPLRLVRLTASATTRVKMSVLKSHLYK